MDKLDSRVFQNLYKVIMKEFVALIPVGESFFVSLTFAFLKLMCLKRKRCFFGESYRDR